MGKFSKRQDIYIICKYIAIPQKNWTLQVEKTDTTWGDQTWISLVIG